MRERLLPGVTERHVAPAVRIHSANEVERARRNAAARDLLQAVLIAIVDWTYLRWPASHIPLLTRDQTLLVLVIANAAILGYMWGIRAIPRWKARRIAATWSPREKRKFLAR